MNDRFSIISVVKNNADGLHNTLSSVYEQSYARIQTIVVDGLSQDHIHDVVSQFPLDVFISEQDTGIYDAMNKAIPHIKGDWVLFLNTGDTLVEKDCLAKIHQLIPQPLPITPFIICGDTQELFHGESIIRHSRPISDLPVHLPACHQSILFHQSLVTSHHFDPSYKICGDLEQLVRIISSTPTSPLYVPFVISCIEGEGLSNRLWKTAIQEQKRIQTQYFNDHSHKKKLSRYHRIVIMKKYIRMFLPTPLVLLIRRVLSRFK